VGVLDLLEIATGPGHSLVRRVIALKNRGPAGNVIVCLDLCKPGLVSLPILSQH
jgi:hypothetical protein